MKSVASSLGHLGGKGFNTRGHEIIRIVKIKKSVALGAVEPGSTGFEIIEITKIIKIITPADLIILLISIHGATK